MKFVLPFHGLLCVAEVNSRFKKRLVDTTRAEAVVRAVGAA